MDHNNTKPSIGKKLLSIRVVEISREPFELYNILKFENMVENGGEAKTAVAAGLSPTSDQGNHDVRGTTT